MGDASDLVSFKSRLSLSDQLACAFANPMKLFGSFFFGSFITVGVVFFVSWEIAIQSLIDFTITALMAITAGFVVFPLFIAIVLLIQNSVFYFRLSSSQKKLVWEFSKKGLSAEDEAGNKISVPWGEVKQIWETKHYLFIRTRPNGARIVPKRNMGDNDAAHIHAFYQNSL